MNILYIGNLNLPNKNAAASRVVNNSKILNSLGHRVYILGITKNFFESSSSFYRHLDNIFLYKYFSRRKIIPFNNIKKIIKELKIDMVIAYNLNSWTLLHLKLHCMIKKIKILGDITEWYSSKGYIFPLNLLKKIDTFLRMRILNAYMDGLILISDYLKIYYKKKASIKLPPLIDLEDNVWKKNNKKQKLKEDIIKFSYIGNVGKDKDNLRFIIDEFRKIKENFKLYIIGLKSIKHLFNEQNLIKNLKTDNRFVFVGRVKHDVALAYLKEIDYSLIIREKSRMNNAGFPTKFVEAVTCNTKIIATDTSDLYKYSKIIDGIHLINKREFKNLIETLINSKIEYKNRNAKSKETNNFFDYKNFISTFNEFLNSILNIKE